MKKALSVLLALVFIFSVFTVSSFAEDKTAKLSVTLSSDISGLTCDDLEKLIIINDDSLKLADTGRTDSVLISDYAGNICFDELKPGRKYYIDYGFVANDGYVIPDAVSDDMVNIETDSGVEVLWYSRTVGTDVDGNQCNYISLNTKVTVKGNFIQNLFGAIADFFLKLSAWSPY
ncbi:MAG: hypothetical protein MJ168_06125 [Clostridia bacterium]|nr:hypothetical protein [Clostridia bacterium]